MEFHEFLSLIRRKRQTIFVIMLVGIILTTVFSLAQTMKYSVHSRLLVVQNSIGDDTYALSKSNEYLGNLFAEIIRSSSFYDQTLNSNFNIDRSYFSGTYSQQIKKWGKAVETKTQSNTGIIDVSVYHPNVQEAKKIALAINNILISNNQNYQGGQNVRINIIDQPLSSAYPTKPNLPFNLLAAALISLFLAFFYIYVFPEEEYDIRLFSKRKKKTKVFKNQVVEQLKYETINREAVEMEMPELETTETKTSEMEMPEEHAPLNGNIRNIIGR